jgi:hypothetical protein
MTPEDEAQRLLADSYARAPAEIFPMEEADPARLEAAKAGADLLVAARLASFADEGRTQITPSAAGRYWATHGGYLAYLIEEPAGRGGGRGRNPELEAMRMDLMKLRLNTFWWSFGLSIAGFVFSIISLTVAYFYGERLLR